SGELDRAAAFYDECTRAWLQSESLGDCFKPLIGLADVGAALGRYTEASRLIGAAEENMKVHGMELMPFDKPGYERAVSRSRAALGSAVFELHLQAGRQMAPDEWLLV